MSGTRGQAVLKRRRTRGSDDIEARNAPDDTARGKRQTGSLSSQEKSIEVVIPPRKRARVEAPDVSVEFGSNSISSAPVSTSRRTRTTSTTTTTTRKSTDGKRTSTKGTKASENRTQTRQSSTPRIATRNSSARKRGLPGRSQKEEIGDSDGEDERQPGEEQDGQDEVENDGGRGLTTDQKEVPPRRKRTQSVKITADSGNGSMDSANSIDPGHDRENAMVHRRKAAKSTEHSTLKSGTPKTRTHGSGSTTPRSTRQTTRPRNAIGSTRETNGQTNPPTRTPVDTSTQTTVRRTKTTAPSRTGKQEITDSEESEGDLGDMGEDLDRDTLDVPELHVTNMDTDKTNKTNMTNDDHGDIKGAERGLDDINHNHSTPPLQAELNINNNNDDSGDSDEDIEFEDVPVMEATDVSLTEASLSVPDTGGDLELTLAPHHRLSLTNMYGGKRAPSKLDKRIRVATHTMHVRTLLWHCCLRNAWVGDVEVQAILVSHLPRRLFLEVEEFQSAMRRSLRAGEDDLLDREKDEHESEQKREAKGEEKVKLEEDEDGGKRRRSRRPHRECRSHQTADKSQTQENSLTMRNTKANKGVAQDKTDSKMETPKTDAKVPAAKTKIIQDPERDEMCISLLQHLAAWWHRTFHITKPGQRKWGYMSMERLDRLLKAWAKHGQTDERFGERLADREAFRECARACRGSRDTGAYLFTALLRGIGLEARVVANLQPVGFGWTKTEDADQEETDEGVYEGRYGLPKHLATADAGGGATEDATGGATDDAKGRDGLKKKGTDKKGVPKGGAQGRKQAGKTSLPKESTRQEQADKSDMVRRSSRKSQNSRSMAVDTKDVKTDSIVANSDSDSDEDDDADDDFESDPDAEENQDTSHGPALYDRDLEFPHVWTEVMLPSLRYIPVDAVVLDGAVASTPEEVERFGPRGAKADRARQVLAYVVAVSSDGRIKDVTVRYLRKRIWPGKTKGMRLGVEKIAVFNRFGKVSRLIEHDFWAKCLRDYSMPVPNSRIRPEILLAETAEEEGDLVPAAAEVKVVKEGEETLQYYKTSTEFVLARHLRREEALVEGAAPVKSFQTKGKAGKTMEEPVYLRKDVVGVKSAETWHKQGRAPKPDSVPLKRVPFRAATTNRRRELAEAEAKTGAKMLQGLYSWDQTDWIIPPPIENGVIPKNSYGNMDLFVEHMCPRGAVHVPYRGATRVCRRLGIDFAEAVVDFEFGHRMAVPVIHGVVVAEEHETRVLEELRKDEAERARKEDEKRRKAALGRWRKFLMGLRIAQRLREEYGQQADVFGHRGRPEPSGEPSGGDYGDAERGSDLAPEAEHAGGGGGGGFLPDDYDEEGGDMPMGAGGFLPEGVTVEDPHQPPRTKTGTKSHFFPVVDDDDDDDDGEDPFVVEE